MSNSIAFSCYSTYFDNIFHACRSDCLFLVDDLFCYSGCSDYYNGKCYACENDLYIVYSETDLGYFCVTKEKCIEAGLYAIPSQKECYKECPTGMYPKDNECVICIPDCGLSTDLVS